MPSVRVVLALPLLLVLVALLPAVVGASFQLLENGNFEQGKSGWGGPGTSVSGCDPHGGSGGLHLASTGGAAFARQTVAGPLGDGDFALSGYAASASGSPQLQAALVWYDSNGSEIFSRTASFGPGPSYGSFSVSALRPGGAASLRVQISLDAGNAAVCLDDLSLSGPPPPEPTATPSATATPTPTAKLTPLPTASPTSTPRPTNTPKPTNTARPSPTATRASPTATPPPEASGDSESSSAPRSAAPEDSAQTATPAPSPPPHPSPTFASEVSAVLAEQPPAEPEEDVPPLTRRSASDDGVPVVWLVAGALFVAALGGSYLAQRGRR